MELNKKIADQLCTIIALGYTKKELIEGTNKSTVVDTDEADLVKVRDSFAKVNFALTEGQVKMMPRDSAGRVDKSQAPGIVGRDRKAAPEAINSEISTQVAYLEQLFNLKADSSLKGAYVGGMTDISKTELIGPSYLWQYKGNYRTPNAAESSEIHSAYDRAYAVSKKVDDLLTDAAANYKVFREKSLRLVSPYRGTGDKLKWERSANLFASVHGMTRSILHYATTADSNLVRIEIALSKGTCKVASCIPCAIFMASQGYPASAIHFGRGDNWNFYHDTSKSNAMYQSWRRKVDEYYLAGKEVLGDGNRKITECIAYLSDKRTIIPDIFLEALTFESSFADKMQNTLR